MHCFSTFHFSRIYQLICLVFFSFFGFSCSYQTEAIWKRETASPISLLRFSHDHKRLLIGHTDGIIEIWDYQNEQQSLSFPSGFSTIYDANWSPDDQKIIIGGNDAIARIFELTETFPMTALPNSGMVQKITKAFFSPDGLSIILELDIPRTGNSSGPEVVVWSDTNPGIASPYRLPCHFRPVLSQDGKQLLVINGNSAHGCLTEGIAELYQIKPNPLESSFLMDSSDTFPSLIHSAFFLPEEQGIGAVSQLQNDEKQDILCRLKIENSEKKKWVAEPLCTNVDHLENEIQLSANSQDALLGLKNSSGDLRLRLISDLGVSLSRGIWLENLSEISYPLLSPDGQRFVITRKIAGNDEAVQTEFMDAKTGESLFLLGTSSNKDKKILGFSTDGSRFAMTSNTHTVFIWDTTGM